MKFTPKNQPSRIRSERFGALKTRAGHYTRFKGLKEALSGHFSHWVMTSKITLKTHIRDFSAWRCGIASLNSPRNLQSSTI